MSEQKWRMKERAQDQEEIYIQNVIEIIVWICYGLLHEPELLLF